MRNEISEMSQAEHEAYNQKTEMIKRQIRDAEFNLIFWASELYDYVNARPELKTSDNGLNRKIDYLGAAIDLMHEKIDDMDWHTGVLK